MKMNISSLKINISSVVKAITCTSKKVMSYMSVDGYWSIGKTPMSKMIYTNFSSNSKVPNFDMVGVPPFVMIVPKEKNTII